MQVVAMQRHDACVYHSNRFNDDVAVHPLGKLFQVLSKASVLSFFLLDHLKWLQMHRFVPGKWYVLYANPTPPPTFSLQHIILAAEFRTLLYDVRLRAKLRSSSATLACPFPL